MELTSFYETQFAKNWEMKLQQKDSRLAPAVEATSFEGDRKWYPQIDVGSMTEVTERKGYTPEGASTGDKYWIFRRKFEFVRQWDEDDALQLGAISLPDSDEVASAVAAENRTKDAVITSAFDATRYIGATGTTTDAWDTAYDVAVNFITGGTGSNSGLTLAKILEAKRLMDAAEVEDGERFFVCTSQQITDMLLIDKMTSNDYATVKSLVNGTIDSFAGFKFLRYEGLSRNAGTGVRTCFAWHKSGVKFAYNGRNVHMDVLPSRRHCKQLRVVSRMGAVRTQPGKVIRVYADEVL